MNSSSSFDTGTGFKLGLMLFIGWVGLSISNKRHRARMILTRIEKKSIILVINISLSWTEEEMKRKTATVECKMKSGLSSSPSSSSPCSFPIVL